MKPYSLSTVSDVCSDEFNYLGNLKDCNDAVTWIKMKYPSIPRDVIPKSSNQYPGGCYVYTGHQSGGKAYGIYFNSDSTNHPVLYAHQVCIKGTLGNEFYMKGSISTNNNPFSYNIELSVKFLFLFNVSICN